MSVIKGLAGINKELAKRPTGGDFEDKPKARYLSLKGGESVKLVFLQEIDEGSPNFKAKNGTAIFALMHSNPKNWKKNAKCTADEGECYGCAQGWKQKVILYVNVLVDDGKEDPYVAIWNRGLGKGSVAQDLLNMAADEDFDLSISDKNFKFTRTGSTKDDTTYSLSTMPKPHGKNLEDYADDLYDLEKYVFTVSPEKQEAYYLDGQEPEKSGAPVATARSTSVDAEW